MNLLSTIYTDEYQTLIDKNVNGDLKRVLVELMEDINAQFLAHNSLLSQEQLYVANQQRFILQELLTSLTTDREE